MDEQHDQGSSVSRFPPIPERGLATVLAGWTGRGSILEALSVPVEETDERRWTAEDVRRRANRVLLSLIDPALGRWPRRTSQWVDYLPVSKARSRITRSVPFTGVAWAESRRAYGWPPKAFVGKETVRTADMLAVQILRWCADQLNQIWHDSTSLAPDLIIGATQQLETVLSLLDREPLSSAAPLAPGRGDLVALRREGAPWGSVAEVADLLMKADRSTDFLLHRLLIPDDEIRWRLFHLGVLGVVLEALRDAGCRVISNRPLSASSGEPNYTIESPAGAQFLLWFEASGVWPHSGKVSPFAEATAAVRKAQRNNGADLLLLQPGQRAFIVECKYSANPDFVARNGYYQAIAYGTEARARLAEHVVSLAVGPESVVRGHSLTDLGFGRVGLAAPSSLPAMLAEWVSEATSANLVAGQTTAV